MHHCPAEIPAPKKEEEDDVVKIGHLETMAKKRREKRTTRRKEGRPGKKKKNRNFIAKTKERKR